MFTVGMLGVVTLAQIASSPVPSAADVSQLWSSLEGQWDCSGAFADGRLLNADLTFERSFDGRVLHYRHVDRLPNNYIQEASWGLDGATGKLASLAFVGARNKDVIQTALYVVETSSRNSVTWVHQTLLSKPFAPNKFTYTVESGALKMVWEVQRESTWRMGDYLNCRRAK